MIQQYKFIMVFLCLFISCSNSKNREKIEYSKDSTNDLHFEKIAYFIDSYNIDDEIQESLEGNNSYSIDDSLCLYLAKLNKRNLFNNEKYLKIFGTLLEKKYLGVRQSGLFHPLSFPVYNACLLVDKKPSNNFALNIVRDERLNLDSCFAKYANTKPEFICIDSVILILDKLPTMKNDSIHKI